MPLFLISVFGLCRTKKWPDQKKWVANFFYYYCVIMRPKLKKIAYLILPEYFIFSFSYKTPYLGQKGPPCPTGGAEEKIIGMYQEVIQ